jgi:acyl-CoA thioesterase
MIVFKDSYAKALGLQFGDDAVRLTIRPDLINDVGMLLGPVVFSLVDYAMTAELLKVRAAEERIATTHIALNFLASAREGEVVATASLDRKGRSVAFLSARVEHEDGRLLATAIGTFAISW